MAGLLKNHYCGQMGTLTSSHMFRTEIWVSFCFLVILLGKMLCPLFCFIHVNFRQAGKIWRLFDDQWTTIGTVVE